MRSVAPVCVGLVAGLSLLGGASCRSTQSPVSPVANGAEPTKGTPATRVETEPPSRGKRNIGVTETSAVPLYGWFVVGNPEGFISEIGDQMAPPGAGMMFNGTMLKSMASSMLGMNSNVAEHIDLDQPVGCVVASPKTYEVPVACAIGFKGGVRQLVEDLGQEGYISGGSDHAAYTFGDTNLYIGALGNHVIVSSHAELITGGRGLLEKRVVGARTGKRAKDIQMTVYPNVIWGDAEEEITQFSQLASNLTGSTSTGNVGLDAYMRGSANMNLEMYRSMADLEKAEMWFDVNREGVALGYRGTARAGTETAKAYAASQKQGKLDPALLRKLPADAIMLAGLNVDFASMPNDPMFKAYYQVFKEIDDATGTTRIGSMVTDYMKVWADVLTGPMGFAMTTHKDSLGMLYAMKAKPGVDARGAFEKLFTKYPPTAVGPEFAKYVRWSYKKNAAKVDGVPVDVFTVRATKKGAAELDKLPTAAEMKRFLGKDYSFKLSFAQRDDLVYMVMSTKSEKAFVTKLMRAGKSGGAGKGGLAGKLIKENSGGSSLGLVNVGGLIDWVRKVSPDASAMPKIPGRLDDVTFNGRITAKGKRKYELKISQGMIDQFVNL